MNKNAQHHLSHPSIHDDGEELLGSPHDQGGDEDMFGADHAHLFADHKSDDDILGEHMSAIPDEDGADHPMEHHPDHPVAGEMGGDEGAGDFGGLDLGDLHEGHNELDGGLDADVHQNMDIHLPPHNDIAGDLPVDIQLEGGSPDGIGGSIGGDMGGEMDDLSSLLHGGSQDDPHGVDNFGGHMHDDGAGLHGNGGSDFDEMTFDGSHPDGQEAQGFDESQGHVDNLHMHPSDDDDTDDLTHLL